jgi:hypothetical protein
MKPPNDGGPAFPTTQELNANGDVVRGGSDGMSLRDFFAANAPPMPQMWRQVRHDFRSEVEAHARWSYEYADAMLAERAKGGA